jgi:hypothetical protein
MCEKENIAPELSRKLIRRNTGERLQQNPAAPYKNVESDSQRTARGIVRRLGLSVDAIDILRDICSTSVLFLARSIHQQNLFNLTIATGPRHRAAPSYADAPSSRLYLRLHCDHWDFPLESPCASHTELCGERSRLWKGQNMMRKAEHLKDSHRWPRFNPRCSPNTKWIISLIVIRVIKSAIICPKDQTFS